ncbi:MAG TPA: metallophosphoesterase family protein [Candidatus Sumerlaeota bacterium]|nr:metallophosphoesterase family protein [Candidatus Sumerlaeota bacterium]
MFVPVKTIGRFLTILTLLMGELVSAQQPAPPEPIRKGPYLIYPGDPSTMTILWQLDSARPSRLEWGPVSAPLTQSATVSQYQNNFQYQHTLSGLTPGQAYDYRLQGEGFQTSGTFTAAPPATAQSVKFLIYGDSRTHVEEHDRQCGAMLQLMRTDPQYRSLVLHLGDLVENGSDENKWQEQLFTHSWKNLRILLASVPFHAVRGNHENDGVLFRKYWPYPYDQNPKCYGSFDYGPVHLTIVDQYEEGPTHTKDTSLLSAAQLEWIGQDLAATRKPWKLLLLHWPGWSAGPHGNQQGVQKQLQPLCDRYGVAAVIGGHNHNYARAVVDGVEHITAGGGGAPSSKPQMDNKSRPYVLTASPRHHFCKVAVDAQGFHFEAVEPDGKVLDSFTLSAPPQPHPSHL